MFVSHEVDLLWLQFDVLILLRSVLRASMVEFVPVFSCAVAASSFRVHWFSLLNYNCYANYANLLIMLKAGQGHNIETRHARLCYVAPPHAIKSVHQHEPL